MNFSQEQQQNKIRLNVGSGPYKNLPGFINVDLLPGAYIDIVAPAHKLPYEDNLCAGATKIIFIL